MINLNLLKKDDKGEYTIRCTAKEVVTAIADHFVNGWIDNTSKRKCKEFTGSESEAKVLIAEIDSQINDSHGMWQQTQ